MAVEAALGNLPPLTPDENVDQSILVQVFDRIALPTFVIDQEHVVRHWNRALEALTGLDRAQMIGTKNHWKPFYASPRPCLADLILDGARDEDVQRFYTNKYRRSELIPDAFEAEDFFPECGENGEWLHFTAACLYNDRGEVIGAIETLMNISDRKQAEQELRQRERTYRAQSITDSLTQLHNSRYFHLQLEQAVNNGARFQQPFALCFLDLDRFKQLNDDHGHLFGDQVLESFGDLIRNSLRTLDSGYRYGGEEFAILLPGTNSQGAQLVAERIRSRLAEQRIPLEGGETLGVTVSIGITEYQPGDSVKSLLKRADQALYRAKDAGRNRVIVDNRS